jgi:hypothetical protein
MIKRIIFPIVFLIIPFSEVVAQDTVLSKNLVVTGIIASLDKAAPLEYVFIWIPGKRIGTHSLKNGYFELTIPARFKNESLCFSLLSYEKLRVPILEVYKKIDTIFMAEKFIYLDQIKVIAKKPV